MYSKVVFGVFFHSFVNGYYFKWAFSKKLVELIFQERKLVFFYFTKGKIHPIHLVTVAKLRVYVLKATF